MADHDDDDVFRCPKCLSERVHRSRSHGLECFIRLFGLGFFRCHHCKYRFLSFRGWSWRQVPFFLLLLLGALVVWFATQWFFAMAEDP